MTVEQFDRTTGQIATVTPAGPMGMAPGTASLVSWAQEARAAYELAEGLVNTSFCPAQYQRKPYEAAAAMLAGAELGLNPMAALRAFDPIQGQATPKAITLRAVAQSHGCQFRTIEETAERVVLEGRRKGGEWERVTWTIQQARDLKLVEKDNWKKQPKAMLYARATAELCRRLVADAILGIPYSAEEIEDGDLLSGATAAVGPATVTGGEIAELAARRAAQAASKKDAWPAPTGVPAPVATATSTREANIEKAVAIVENALAGGPAPSPEPEPAAVPMVSPQQLSQINAAMKAAGLTTKAQGLAFYADTIGREVAGSKEMSHAEAAKVLDRLNFDASERDRLAAKEEVVEAEVVDEPTPAESAPAGDGGFDWDAAAES